MPDLPEDTPAEAPSNLPADHDFHAVEGTASLSQLADATPGDWQSIVEADDFEATVNEPQLLGQEALSCRDCGSVVVKSFPDTNDPCPVCTSDDTYPLIAEQIDDRLEWTAETADHD